MYPHRTLSVIGGIPAPMVCLIGWLLAASAGATPLSLVFERDDDVAGVVEVFVQTYPTLGDLMGDTNGNGNFSALDINPDYSIGGAFFDGNYNLVFERDTDVAGVVEVFVQTYPTLGDLMGDTNGNGNFSALDINPDYSITGAFFDGTDYNLIFERDDDVAGVVEVFVQTYPTLGDLMGDTNGNGNFSVLDINPDYSIVGAFDLSSAGGSGTGGGASPPTGAVPEPPMGWLLFTGLGLFGLSKTLQRRRTD